MTSFDNKKELRFIITLGTGKFGSNNTDQIMLKGYRASVDVDKAGGVQMSTLRAKIYGVSQADMNAITTLRWKPRQLIQNSVEVYAIDGDVETQVYGGDIVQAWGDYQSTPDVFLHIEAQAAFFNQLVPADPLSFSGPTNVAGVMELIAKKMGLVFENNGVHSFLDDIYLANTLTEQAKDLARAGNFSLYIDDKVLAITNIYLPRAGTIPLISKDSGLVGYPTFDGVGVNFTTLFNPAITFGGAVNLETEIQQAAGVWNVGSMAYRLESEKPGGAWFMQIGGSAGDFAIYK